MTNFKAWLKKARRRRVQMSLLGAGLIILLLPTVASSLTNTIVMTDKTTADYQALSVSPNTLKPKACDGIDLTNVISGDGVINGTAGNDLILATSPNATIDGMGGSDCLVIGNGEEGTLIGGGPANGDTDVDICIGGPDTKYERCEDVQNLN